MKKIFVLMLTVFALSTTVNAVDKKEPEKKYTQEEWDKKMNESNKGSWRAHIRLMYKGDIPYNGVIFAIVKKDPMESYKEDLKMMKSYLFQTSDLEGIKISHISSSWDRIFETVTGNDVSFLENDVKGGYHFTYGSNDFSKRWLVTRAMNSNGKLIAIWSIPLNIKKGKTIEVTLTEKNMVSDAKLEKIYDSITK